MQSPLYFSGTNFLCYLLFSLLKPNTQHNNLKEERFILVYGFRGVRVAWNSLGQNILAVGVCSGAVRTIADQNQRAGAMGRDQ